jgi:haloalkane dehalogenase
VHTVRTPDERFEQVPDYPYEPRYAEIDDLEGSMLRVAYIDEGPATADPVLLLHGEPTWGYLYRHMIPPLLAAGHRVVVPDLVGFGRSDKPTAMSDYTYARHVAWMHQLLIDQLNLQQITLFGQDWGGLIGLRLLAGDPERFARVVLSNTGLPTGHGAPSEAFLAWQQFSQTTTSFPVGAIVNGGSLSALPPEVIAAYDVPFPEDVFTAGARIFPSLVPTTPQDPASADNQAAWEVLARFDRPMLLAYSDGDPVTKGGDAPFRAKVPGAQGRPHITMTGGGHFVQEDCGPELARVINEFIATTR